MFRMLNLYFNSTIVQLIAVGAPAATSASKFQFYYSSINRDKILLSIFGVIRFQFYYSSINSRNSGTRLPGCRDFNSTIVQLIVRWLSYPNQFHRNFNSTIVQLIG